MRDFIVAGLFAVAALVSVIGPLAGVWYLSENSACSRVHALTGVETDMSVSLGCMVKYQGEWVAREVMTNHKQEISVK